MNIKSFSFTCSDMFILLKKINWSQLKWEETRDVKLCWIITRHRTSDENIEKWVNYALHQCSL